MTPHTAPADLVSARKDARKALDEKTRHKTQMQKQLGWIEEGKRAVVCLPLGMTDELGGALLKDLLPGLLSLPVEILIRGKGGAAYGTLFTDLAAKHKDRIAIVPNQDGAVKQMLAASDMALFLTTPSAEDIRQCLAAGVVPVSVAAELLDDYNPNQETGNAFVFTKETVWHAYGALVRAMETFRFPYDWKTIQLHGLESMSRA